MTQILKTEFIDFLQQSDLLTKFFSFLFSEQKKMQAVVVSSSLHYELKADGIRENILVSDQYTLSIGDDQE